MTELHLIVDWRNYFDESQMIENIDKFHVSLCEILCIPKLKNKIQTMSEFYRYYVDDDRGEMDFTAYIVRSNKEYGYRETAKGRRRVNVNMFDLKMFLREFDGSVVHTTDNIHETKHALTVLGLYEKYVCHFLKSID